MNVSVVRPGIQPDQSLREVGIVPTCIESVEIKKHTVIVTLKRRRKRFHFGFKTAASATECYEKIISELRDV